VGEWQAENGEPLGQIFFHPGGEFWGVFGIEGDELLELLLGGGKVWTVEEAADSAGDLSALIQTRDMGLSILLEVELAALPRDGWEDGGACGFEADVVVADDELDAGQAALAEALKESAPVNFGFAERDTDAQEGAFAVGIYAHGQEHGAVEQLTVEADFFVACIQHEIRAESQGACAPFFQFGIEEFGAFTDLGGADGSATELLDNSGDFAGRDALDIHFGEGEFEGLFGAQTFLERAGIERDVAADLGDVEFDGTQPGGEGFILEAIGVAQACVCALVRLGLEGL